MLVKRGQLRHDDETNVVPDPTMNALKSTEGTTFCFFLNQVRCSKSSLWLLLGERVVI